MKWITLCLASLFPVLTSFAAYAEQSSDGGVAPSMSESNGHRYVTGVVKSINDGVVLLKTDEGTTRDLSLKEVEQEEIKGLAVGDFLRLEMDPGNEIVNIDRIDRRHMRSRDEVQYIEGRVDRYDPMERVVTLQLGDGISKSYRMEDAAATKMNAVTEGTRVRLELNLKNEMVEDFNRQ